MEELNASLSYGVGARVAQDRARDGPLWRRDPVLSPL